MKRICVFCGSSPGARPEYTEVAVAMGKALAANGLELVYGGGRVGLMGVVADAVLAAGGRVVGVIPRMLMEKEVGHEGVSEMHLTDTMHERKALMAEFSDGFIAMPGGTGTFDESFEILTWSQLGVHRKPFAFLNVAGYYDGLLAFLDHAVDQRFLRDEHRALCMVDTDPERLLARFRDYDPPYVPKWIDRRQT